MNLSRTPKRDGYLFSSLSLAFVLITVWIDLLMAMRPFCRTSFWLTQLRYFVSQWRENFGYFDGIASYSFLEAKPTVLSEYTNATLLDGLHLSCHII